MGKPTGIVGKPIYRMSESGACPKVLGAIRLGYEPIPETEASLRIMRESQRHEGLVIEDLEEEGYIITDSQKEYIIETPILILKGHIDGIAQKNTHKNTLEIKALGRFTFQKYQSKGLDEFFGYKAQITCYSKATELPILLAVKNRDTGEIIKTEFKEPPMSFNDIVDKLNMVELCVMDGVLPDAEFSDDRDQCRWCRFKYLCSKPEVEEKVKLENLPTLVEAAQLHKEGKELAKLADERIESAKETFLAHSKSNKVDKFKVAGVSVSYLGQRQKRYLDEVELKKLVSEDILNKAYKLGKPWEDIRIRILKEEGVKR